jgi:hypothetical protein
MGAYLEVWTPAGRELVPLEGGRLTLGADPATDLALPTDPTLSRLTVEDELRKRWIAAASPP